jgi:glycosyltransferase involved in cell wall biosynthesis
MNNINGSVYENFNPEARAWAARLRVALAHDWLLGMRGGERVLEILLRLFPRAGVHTLFYDPRRIGAAINRRAVHPSPLSRLPGVGRYYRTLLPILPRTAGRMPMPPEADLVISTSHCAVHGVRAPAGARHLTYCFSPMRYLYDQQGAYALGGSGAGVKALNLFAPRLRRWDAEAARRCDAYWAISQCVASRIERIYGRAAPVVYPPVRTEYFTPRTPSRTGSSSAAAPGPFLIVSALAPYKRVDLAIRAANALGKDLAVVGSGPLFSRLRRLAGPTVRFLGWVSDEKVRELYRDCRALIFPGHEDFGIVPVEAMACGKPVLALRAGGLIETMVEGETGAFFEAPETEALVQAWRRFDPAAYDPRRIRVRAERFGLERFLNEFAGRLHAWMRQEGAKNDEGAGASPAPSQQSG